MEKKKRNIAVFISGTGTLLEAVMSACEMNELNGCVKLVISDREAYGIERANNHHVENYITKDWEYIDNLLDEEEIDFIILAGFLRLFPKKIIEKHKGNIINMHPALLPKFGGKGMYGLNVHKAVIEAGEKVTGSTVHYVDELFDNGKIIAQSNVLVSDDDTPEVLLNKVKAKEPELLVKTLKKIL